MRGRLACGRSLGLKLDGEQAFTAKLGPNECGKSLRFSLSIEEAIVAPAGLFRVHRCIGHSNFIAKILTC